MRHYLSAIFLSLFMVYGFNGTAQTNPRPYFYFEGDLSTPIYVKVEGKMQPRYGQNHFIISNLAPGYTHFQILFQQNQYPEQDFLLNVPEKGFRSFSLKKINDQQFALYDQQQKRYIISGNKKEDDQPIDYYAISSTAGQDEVTTTSGVPEDLTDDLPAFQPKSKKADDKKVKPTSPKKTKPVATKKNNKKKDWEEEDRLPLLPDDSLYLPEGDNYSKRKAEKDVAKESVAQPDSFLNHLVLNKNRDEQEDVATLPSSTSATTQATDANRGKMRNGRCVEAMDNDAFEDFALQFMGGKNDNVRLKFLKKNSKGLCFSSEQDRILLKSLDMQSSRYDAAGILYPRTADQENFKDMVDLFNTEFLQNKFLDLIH